MKSHISPFLSPEASSEWVRGALTGWYLTHKADCYAPHCECYSARLNPSEILERIYRSVSKHKASNFAKGVVLLLSDERTLLLRRCILEEFFMLASMMRNKAVLRGLIALLESNALRISDEGLVIANAAFSAGKIMGFRGISMLTLVNAAEKYIHPSGVDVRGVLLAYAREDKANWHTHFLRLQLQFEQQEQVELNYKPKESMDLWELVRENFITDLKQAMGKQRFREQIKLLNEQGHLENFAWLGQA